MEQKKPIDTLDFDGNPDRVVLELGLGGARRILQVEGCVLF